MLSTKTLLGTVKPNITPLLLLSLLAILFAAGCASQQPQPQTPPVPQTPPASSGGGSHIIEITASGFSPDALTVSAGDTIVWVNKDTQPHLPASAVHPTHKAYPGSDIKKCGTVEQSTIFDACKALAKGETFSFTFNEKGTWKYHDHLTAGFYGTLVVQ